MAGDFIRFWLKNELFSYILPFAIFFSLVV